MNEDGLHAHLRDYYGDIGDRLTCFSEYTTRAADNTMQCEDLWDLERLLRRLDARPLATLTLLYRYGMSRREVGELVGNVSSARVQQIEAKALHILRHPSSQGRKDAYLHREPYVLTERKKRTPDE